MLTIGRFCLIDHFGDIEYVKHISYNIFKVLFKKNLFLLKYLAFYDKNSIVKYVVKHGHRTSLLTRFNGPVQAR